MRRLFAATLALVLSLLSLDAYGQSELQRSMENGAEIYTTNFALITTNPLRPVKVAVQSVSKNGILSYRLLMQLTDSFRDIREGSMLLLTLDNGSTVSLPAVKPMEWDIDKRVRTGYQGRTVETMDVQYTLSDNDLSTITSNKIESVEIQSWPSTVKIKNKIFDIAATIDSQYKLLAGNNGQAGSTSVASSTVAKEKTPMDDLFKRERYPYDIEILPHVTPATKYFNVPISGLLNLDLSRFCNGYCLVYNRNTNDGYIFDTSGDLQGQLKIDAHSNLPLFSENGRTIVAAQDDNGKIFCALIDAHGKVLARFPRFMAAELSLETGVFHLPNDIQTNQSFWDYYDDNGKRVYSGIAQKIEDTIGPLSCGLRAVNSTYKSGFIDNAGKIVIPLSFMAVSDFSEELAAVSIMDGNLEMWGFIDTAGNYAIKPMFTKQPSDFHEGYAIAKKKNGSSVYIDKHGNVVSPEYRSASRFFNGRAYVSSSERGLVVIDKNFNVLGSTAFSSPYQEQYDSSDGVPAILIDNRDKVTSTYVYFYDNLAVMKYYYGKDGYECGYVNDKGEYVIKFVESEF